MFLYHFSMIDWRDLNENLSYSIDIKNLKHKISIKTNNLEVDIKK